MCTEAIESIDPSLLFVIRPGYPYTHVLSSFVITLLFLVSFYSLYWNQKLPVPSRFTFSCFVDPLGRCKCSPRYTILNSPNRLARVHWWLSRWPIRLSATRSSQAKRSTAGWSCSCVLNENSRASISVAYRNLMIRRAKQNYASEDKARNKEQTWN